MPHSLTLNIQRLAHCAQYRPFCRSLALQHSWKDRPVMSLCDYLTNLGKDKTEIESVLEEAVNEVGEEDQNTLNLPIETVTEDDVDATFESSDDFI